MHSEYVVGLSGDLDPAQVGLKAVRLVELAREGVRVPEGFAVTTSAYREFVSDARLGAVIAREVRRFRAGRDVVVAAAEIRSAFRDAWLPPTVVDAIRDAYRTLGGNGTDVAVRCSPRTPAEAVQADVFLHLTTVQDVLMAFRRCAASLFSTVAVGSREAEGIDPLGVAMPVIVQRMVRADLGSSGTAQAESTFVQVRAWWGLGEPRQGTGADEFDVHAGERPLIVKHRGAKLMKTVYAEPRGTRSVPTWPEERVGLVLSDEELQQLARWSMVADEHFRRPVTLEWAKDGHSGALYVLGVRPRAASELTIRARGRRVLEPFASLYG